MWYDGMLFMHTPVWIMAIVLGHLLFWLKINYKILAIVSGIILLLQLWAVYNKMEFEIDFDGVYYGVDYVFCLSLFRIWLAFPIFRSSYPVWMKKNEQENLV